MFSFKKSLIALASLLVLVIALTTLVPLVGRGQGNSQNAPGRDVNVINTPLPVTGTVNIGNLGESPLPVRDVDNPARQPIQANIIRIPPQIPDPQFFTVPAGKRLVIEYVSADVEASNPQCVTAPRFALKTTASGTTLDHFFYTQLTGTLGAAANEATRAYGLSQQTRIYADPNTHVILDIRTSAFPSCGFSIVDGLHITGYLVDVP